MTPAMILEAVRLCVVVAAFYKIAEIYPQLVNNAHVPYGPRMFGLVTLVLAIVGIAAGLPGLLLGRVTWMDTTSVMLPVGSLIAWTGLYIVFAIKSVAITQRPVVVACGYSLLLVASLWASYMDKAV